MTSYGTLSQEEPSLQAEPTQSANQSIHKTDDWRFFNKKNPELKYFFEQLEIAINENEPSARSVLDNFSTLDRQMRELATKLETAEVGSHFFNSKETIESIKHFKEEGPRNLEQLVQWACLTFRKIEMDAKKKFKQKELQQKDNLATLGEPGPSNDSKRGPEEESSEALKTFDETFELIWRFKEVGKNTAEGVKKIRNEFQSLMKDKYKEKWNWAKFLIKGAGFMITALGLCYAAFWNILGGGKKESS